MNATSVHCIIYKKKVSGGSLATSLLKMFEKLRKEGKTVEQCEVEVGEQFNLNATLVHSIIYRKKVWGGSPATSLLENDSKTH